MTWKAITRTTLQPVLASDAALVVSEFVSLTRISDRSVADRHKVCVPDCLQSGVATNTSDGGICCAMMAVGPKLSKALDNLICHCLVGRPEIFRFFSRNLGDNMHPQQSRPLRGVSAADPSDFVSGLDSHVPQALRKFPLRISMTPNSLAEVLDPGMCQGYAKRAHGLQCLPLI